MRSVLSDFLVKRRISFERRGKEGVIPFVLVEECLWFVESDFISRIHGVLPRGFSKLR